MFNESEKMYHIGLSKEDIKGATFAILPGDPDRVLKIASYFDSYIKLNTVREYTSYLCKLNDKNVLVISTGMGGPSTAICVEELNMIGIKNLIRVGTCGGMQLNVEAGDLIIAQGAIRQEGTSKEYVPVEYPALADISLINALIYSCKKNNYKYHVGVVQSKDSFYGQHDPKRMPSSYELESKWNAWIKAGCLASEMECASLYITASTLKMNACAILLAIWNQERANKNLDNNKYFDNEKEIKAAIDAIRILL